MTRPAGEETSARRFLITWLILLGLLLAAFAGTVAILNSTVYSASGFVGSYLNALARHDVGEALSTPGVTPAATGSKELLAATTLATLTDIRLVKDTENADGSHLVVYRYQAGGQSGTSAFLVKRDGVRFGVFSRWTFQNSPVGVLTVTPLHAAAFTANGVPLKAKKPGDSVSYQVLTPASITLSHESAYFAAAPKAVLVTHRGTVHADVDIQANKAFVSELQKQLDAQLKQCTTQKVLLPTGCPFGQSMENRIVGEPDWSIARYPKLTIVPSEKAGQWNVPATPGAAHLKVKVRSLFDGTVSDFDRDVPFTVRYSITFSDAGEPTITAVG
jgi:hypothetical protein